MLDNVKGKHNQKNYTKKKFIHVFYVTVRLDDYKSPFTLLFLISNDDFLLQIRENVNASF